MKNVKFKKYEFLQTLSDCINKTPSAEDFLREFPGLVQKFFPITQVVVFYRSETGKRFLPFPDIFDGSTVPFLDEQSDMIRGFIAHPKAMLLDAHESIYSEIFNKNTAGLLYRSQMNLIIPLHCRRYYRGIMVCRLDPKKKNMLKEIEEMIRAAAQLFIPIIETERMELENDRNYYRLFKFDRLVLLGEMVAAIAHELKTPMSTVLLEVQEMDSILEEQGNHSMNRSCKKIETEIQRIDQFIRSLLNFSKFNEMAIENLSLNEFVKQAMAEVPRKRQPEGLKLDSYLGDKQSIKIDRNRLRQVFFNILFNAFDAAGSGGAISIKTYRQPYADQQRKGEQHVIAIKDNGPGIPDELWENVLTPFYTTKEDGTGLGLYISQEIMKNLDGELKLESNENGTTVYLILPGGSK
jgi:two-component system, NtrC family, sensor kinase